MAKLDLLPIFQDERGLKNYLVTNFRRIAIAIAPLEAPVAATPAPIDVPFTYAGALSVSTSPKWFPQSNVTLFQVYASLVTAGTSNTVLTVYQNGASIGTITMGSGVVALAVTFNTAFVANVHYIQVGITTVGTGAAGLTAQARFN